MKTEIHPKYKSVNVECSCGYKFKVGTTLNNEILHIDVCSECHPFYTGKQKLVDTEGRIDKFRNKYRRGSAPKQPDADQSGSAQA